MGVEIITLHRKSFRGYWLTGTMYVLTAIFKISRQMPEVTKSSQQSNYL